MKTLKQHIEDAGFTQVDVADAFGLTRIAVNKWVREGMMPRPEHLTKLAEMIGVSIDEIVRCQIQRKAEWIKGRE